MILHRTGLIELDYNEKDDILRVKWPDITAFAEAEIEHSLHLLIDSIKHYDIKKLLIDSRDTISHIDTATYRNILSELMRGLETTRLQKVARMASADPTRESRVQVVAREITSVVDLAMQFGNFDNEAQAMAWLKE